MVCTIPFGFAVVPLVYMRKSRSSLSIGSHGHDAGSSGAPSPSSCHQWSRPSCIGTSLPVRRSTTEARTLGAAAIASSAVRFSGTNDPRRHASSCVISTSHSMSFMRPESESAEKPPKTTVCGAPSRVHASIATASSGTMPM